MAYIDTSVLVACYCPEALSDRAEQTVREDVAPAISPLSEVEFYSALSLKTRSGKLALEDATRIAALFQLHISQERYRFLPVTVREFRFARDWIAPFSSLLRTLDAIHMAVAFANDLVLVTADKPLASAAKDCGVQCQLLE